MLTCQYSSFALCVSFLRKLLGDNGSIYRFPPSTLGILGGVDFRTVVALTPLKVFGIRETRSVLPYSACGL